MMGIQEFGDRLLESRDLDPLYCGLYSARLPRPQLARYLLSYWTFYHVGSAAWMSALSGDTYWHAMRASAVNETSPRDLGLPSDRWPRGAERRHFRGAKCVAAVDWLRCQVTDPMVAMDWLSREATAAGVMRLVQGWPLFGPWISFKVADMMERVWGSRVEFPYSALLLYDEPRAALTLMSQGVGVPGGTPRDQPLEWYLDKVSQYFAPRPAPPGGRRCGPQEVETIMCKFKSYAGGHYHIGKDIRDHRAALVGWGDTADKLLAYYPQEVA